MIAALYVQPAGIYASIDGVQTWGLPERDAREYAGPWPVVAHPPCARWCLLAHMVESRWGHQVGDDGGTFAAALDAVRKWGGVLEHPAWTMAWAAHGLTDPIVGGGWQRDLDGGWTCEVYQRRYGHRADKRTWLYTTHPDPPPLRWGRPSGAAECVVGHAANRSARPQSDRLSRREGSATPIAFARELITIAAGTRSTALQR